MDGITGCLYPPPGYRPRVPAYAPPPPPSGPVPGVDAGGRCSTCGAFVATSPGRYCPYCAADLRGNAPPHPIAASKAASGKARAAAPAKAAAATRTAHFASQAGSGHGAAPLPSDMFVGLAQDGPEIDQIIDQSQPAVASGDLVAWVQRVGGCRLADLQQLSSPGLMDAAGIVLPLADVRCWERALAQVARGARARRPQGMGRHRRLYCVAVDLNASIASIRFKILCSSRSLFSGSQS